MTRIAPSKLPPERVRTIIVQVAEKHKIPLEALSNDSRLRRHAHPRQEAMALIRELRRPDGNPFSYPQIGSWLGGLDHTTVRFGVMAHGRRAGEGQ